MMENIMLVSPEFIRNTTNISSNMQDKFIMSAIREACDIDFQEIVGEDLYNKLKLLIAEDKIKLPGFKKYKDILDIAKYYLAYSVVTRLVVISTIKLDNIGANTTADEKVEPLQLKDVFTTENYYHNKADYYKKKLQNFLIKNNDKYDELKNSNTNINLYSACNCNIWLGGNRGKIRI